MQPLLHTQNSSEEIKKIYLTKDKGRAHIALNEHYQGSVNCYNNFFSKLITKLFRTSLNVTIEGKTLCANKKSYKNFIKSIKKNELSSNIENFKVLTREQMTPVTNLGLMRDHLSRWKSYRLSQKLIKAMVNDDKELALEAIGKGADVNRGFLLKDKKIAKELPIEDIPPFERVWYTPHLYAIINQKQDLADLLVQYGADITKKGNKCQFKRETFKVKYSPFNRALHYKDTYSDRKALIYDEDAKQVREVPNKYQEYVEVKPVEGYNEGNGPQIDYYTYINSQNIKDLNSHKDLEKLIHSRNKNREFVEIKHSAHSNLQMYVHYHYYLSNKDIEKENLPPEQYEAFLERWHDEIVDE